MQIKFDYKEIKNSRNLPSGDLPVKDVHLLDPTIKTAPKIYKDFSSLLNQIMAGKDPVLGELFTSLLAEKVFTIPVVATQGIPQPYEAWCTDEGIIYFNLSLWDSESLCKQGNAVLLHEVTHVLLREIHGKPEGLNWTQKLDFLVFDEGFSHFTGFPLGRDKLLTKYLSRWQSAEDCLSKAYAKLNDPSISKDEKLLVLEAADTGSFWEKYGAISGMFRVAYFYNNDKTSLCHYIQQMKLPKPNKFGIKRLTMG